VHYDHSIITEFHCQVFAARTSELITFHQIPLKPKLPREGWVEQDPLELLSAVRECISKTVDNLKQLEISPSDVVATGVTNQRETTVVWDKTTGQPLYNTIGAFLINYVDLLSISKHYYI